MEDRRKVSFKNKDSEFLKEFQQRFEKKIKENEISVIEYWKERLDKLSSMRPDGISSLQIEIKKLSDMMKNRIKILKRG
jgi:hypothetical protein